MARVVEEELCADLRSKIARNSFPKPPVSSAPEEIDIVTAAPSRVSTVPAISAEASTLTELDTQATTGNTPPSFSQDEALSSSSPKMPPPPVIPAFPFPSPFPAPLAKEATPPPPGTLDLEDETLLASLCNILTTQFDVAPPYTIQRLSELIRYPNTHYKSLSKYLRAIQRVLSVSSPITAFPLPPSAVDSMPNGTASFNLGSDESLGGALLSPIPWLSESPLTEGAEGVNGVSQGELLRQEQELNIVPAAQVSSPPEGVHAEGPPALGPEDVGPQPEGTVFPDPPATIEEAMSPRPAPIEGKEEEMGDAVKGADKEKEAKDGESEVKEVEAAEVKDGMGEKTTEGEEAEKEREKEKEADEKEKQQSEDKKDIMDLDTKEPEPPKEPVATETKDKDESSEMMQLDTPTTDTKTTLPAAEKNSEEGDQGTIS
ncbi:hypothetical protein L873DRAFT_1839261 [Choiromyces venosus 120613-1]|uniref:PPP4R2-domain-containing protein n=1 Tax=Choiromyces venosus 120613-1 TaxID=1336337 RepID=A0A3N4IT30_9PEZI|nr:hypothetical protein L873DRAFT_1839261 [Choiromyces venosus 120613-1]